MRASWRWGLVVRRLKPAALRRVGGEGGRRVRRGRLGWAAAPSLAIALIPTTPTSGRQGAVAVFEECRCRAAGDFGAVGGFEDVAEAGDGLHFRIGEHVAGAEFEERGDARDERDHAVLGHEGGELTGRHGVHAAEVGHVVGAVEPVVDELELFVGEVGHGRSPARERVVRRGENASLYPIPLRPDLCEKIRAFERRRRREHRGRRRGKGRKSKDLGRERWRAKKKLEENRTFPVVEPRRAHKRGDRRNQSDRAKSDTAKVRRRRRCARSCGRLPVSRRRRDRGTGRGCA